MNDTRKRILVRAGKGALALAVSAVTAALTSPAFREFVGDETLTAVLVGALVPALLAAEKALKLRRE